MDMGILWLLIAGAIGFVVGWLVRAQKSVDPTNDENSVLVSKLRQRDEELAAVRAENTVHLATLDTLRNEIATMKKKLEAYEHGDRRPKKKQPRTAKRVSARRVPTKKPRSA